MSKKKKKRIVLIIILALIAVAVIVGLIGLYNRNNKAYVRLVSDYNYTWVLYNSSSSGTIIDAAEQNIYLQETQQVAEVYVTEGQRVAQGDALFRYDTQTLELEVKQRQLEVSFCDSALALARQQLAAYEKIVPSAASSAEPSEPSEPGAYTPTVEQQLPAAYQGDGSDQAPLTYLCSEATLVSGSQINQWIEQALVAVLELRENDDPSGALLSAWTIDGRNFLAVAEDSLWSVATRSPWQPPEQDQDYPPAEQAPTYTQAQKDKLIADQQLTIRRMENSLALAKNALAQSESRLDDATVRSAMSGTVKAIGDPASPPQDGSAFCTVSAATGVTLTGSISELDLASSHVGDRLTVTSWMTGESSDATITYISDYPTDSAYWYGNGNPNVSYYQFTAYMEDASGFGIGEDVDIQPYREEMEDCIVVDRIYVRTDEQGAYMFVDDGTGHLTRREVTVASTPESDFLQITSGLSLDDYYAFPYGKTAREGALTTKERPFSLWF